MNRRSKIILVAGAALLTAGLVAGIAEARGPGDRWHAPMHGMGMLMLDQVDTNGDRRVEKPEIDSFIAGNLQQADANGDGQLTQAEFTTFLTTATKPFQVRSFQFFDADGNGEVTAAELQRPADRFFARHERDGAIGAEPRRRGHGPDDDRPRRDP